MRFYIRVSVVFLMLTVAAKMMAVEDINHIEDMPSFESKKDFEDWVYRTQGKMVGDFIYSKSDSVNSGVFICSHTDSNKKITQKLAMYSCEGECSVVRADDAPDKYRLDPTTDFQGVFYDSHLARWRPGLLAECPSGSWGFSNDANIVNDTKTLINFAGNDFNRYQTLKNNQVTETRERNPILDNYPNGFEPLPSYIKTTPSPSGGGLMYVPSIH